MPLPKTGVAYNTQLGLPDKARTNKGLMSDIRAIQSLRIGYGSDAALTDGTLPYS